MESQVVKHVYENDVITLKYISVTGSWKENSNPQCRRNLLLPLKMVSTNGFGNWTQKANLGEKCWQFADANHNKITIQTFNIDLNPKPQCYVCGHE